MKAIVAIVGKPNVGKSTLFNRLIGENKAIVSEIAGTTRDRIYATAELESLDIILVDTGGLQYGEKKDIESDVHAQALIAMEEADLIIFLVDGSRSLDASDEVVIKELRKKKKDVLFVANKVDRKDAEGEIPELYKAGLGKPIEISSAHGRNMFELEREIEKKLRIKGFRKEKPLRSRQIQIAILGRPNVGKSSLTNVLLGKKNVIVSDIPGTTRDAIDTELIYKVKKITLIDTAGLRKRGKIGRKIEYWSILRGIKALERCDIAVLVIDTSEGIVSQDEHIAGFIKDERKGLVIVLNKIDLIDAEDRERTLHRLKYKMQFLPWAPVVFTSTLTGENIQVILDLALQIHEERSKKIPQKDLHELLQDIQLEHAPPSSQKTRSRIIHAAQTGTNPPRIEILVSDPEAFHFSYRRYVERKIREKFGFDGTGIAIRFNKAEKKNQKF